MAAAELHGHFALLQDARAQHGMQRRGGLRAGGGLLRRAQGGDAGLLISWPGGDALALVVTLSVCWVCSERALDRLSRQAAVGGHLPTPVGVQGAEVAELKLQSLMLLNILQVLVAFSSLFTRTTPTVSCNPDTLD